MKERLLILPMKALAAFALMLGLMPVCILLGCAVLGCLYHYLLLPFLGKELRHLRDSLSERY